MGSPIACLWGNIIHTFETITNSSLEMHKKNIADRNFSRFISYNISKTAIKTPSVDLKKKEIIIHETYLEHLWAFIYSTLVIYEEAIMKPYIDDTFKGEIEFSNQITKRAWELFRWSISLSENYSMWDTCLPNPKYSANVEEKKYSETANAIFQKSVAFVLYHEYAHLDLEHKAIFLKNNEKKVRSEDYIDFICMEKESDLYAFEIIMDGEIDDDKKLKIGLSFLMVFLSSLFLIKNPIQIQQTKHPDIDQRILDVLLKLDFEKEKNKFYGWYLCTIIMRLFFLRHNKNIEAQNFETANNAFFYYLEKIDKIKK